MVRVRHLHGFLELCCDHDSGLSTWAPSYDFVPVRITEDERFDLDSGVGLARTFVDSCVDCEVWGSLPCRPWCTWSFLNEKKFGPAYAARLGWRRRQSLKMVKSFEEVALLAMAFGGGAHFEWPAFCRGWQRRRVQRMLSRLGLAKVRFDGCSFGVMASATLLALEPWVVATSSPQLAAALAVHRCTKLHEHGPLSGAMATRSGHYLEAMCRCVLRSLRRPASAWRPVRHGLRVYGRARLLRAGPRVRAACPDPCELCRRLPGALRLGDGDLAAGRLLVSASTLRRSKSGRVVLAGAAQPGPGRLADGGAETTPRSQCPGERLQAAPLPLCHQKRSPRRATWRMSTSCSTAWRRPSSRTPVLWTQSRDPFETERRGKRGSASSSRCLCRPAGRSLPRPWAPC